MNKLLFLLTLPQLIASFTTIKNAPKATFDGRAYDTSLMMDFTDSTTQEVDDYYGDVGELIGEDLKEYLYDVISANNYFLTYGSGTSSGVSMYYQITDRNWDISEPISPETFTFDGEADDDYYLRLLYSTGNDSRETSYNNSVNGYSVDTSLNHIDYANRKKPNNNVQVDKEHVWAKDHGFGGDPTKGAGTDLHHLIAADHRTNNIHNNLYYGEVEDLQASTTDEVECYLANGRTELSGYKGYDADGEMVFEPLDEYKGDIARAIFYMATRYGINTGANTKAEPYLVVTDDDSLEDDSDKFYGVHHNLSDLLDWNDLDPVDEYEYHRNNLIYKNVQRNRNPYIDHPEWVRRVFDEDYSLELPDITLESNYNLHIGETLTLDFSIESYTDIKWNYDDSVIDVDQTNLTITPKKAGSTTLLIEYKNGNENKIVSTLINIKDKIAIADLSFSEIRLFSGETYQFPNLTYQNLFSDEKITFSTSDEEIASIDDTGLITGKKPGECNLIISVTDDANNSQVLSNIKLTIEVNERQKYLMIIIIAAILLVIVIIAIFMLVHHVNKKGSKNPKNKEYTKKRRK